MSLLINNFAKGWVNRSQRTLPLEGTVYVATDVDFIDTGNFRCRKKHKRSVPGLPTISNRAPSGSIYKLPVEGVDKYLLFYADINSLKCRNSLTNYITAVSTKITSSRHVSYAALKPELSDYTYVYITDGVTMVSYNGTVSRTWGIDPPDGSVSVMISAYSGSLTAGAYSYSYTFYDGTTGSESDPSPGCSALTATTDQAIEVSGIQISGNTRVTARRLYRTVADGGTRYLVAIIPDNVSTTFTDTVADSSLTHAIIADQGIPPLGDVVVATDDTLFLSGNTNYHNRVYFCMTNNPDNWPSTYYIDVGPAGTHVQNIAIAEGRVYFVTRSGMYSLHGDNPDTYDTLETKAGIGTYARWSVASVGGAIYYLARDGVYRFDGIRSTNISRQINKLFWDTPSTLYSVVDRPSAESMCRATGFMGMYYLIVPLKDTTGTVYRKLLEYNPTEDQWRLIGTKLYDIFGDDASGELLGMTDTNFVSGASTCTLYDILANDSGLAVDTPSPEVVTRTFDITAAPEYPVKVPEKPFGVTERRVTEISWLREYRIDADGSWTFEFYLDDVMRYTITLSNLDSSSAYTWRNFSTSMKGRYLYVRITSSDAGPTTHIVREIEVR